MNHLNQQELDALRQRLDEQRTLLRDEIRGHLLNTDTEQYTELAGQVHDTADEAIADLLADVNIAVVGRLIGELRQIEAAMQRISTGAYGVCEDCGAAIPFPRLEAYPTATRCVADQERHEKFYAEENKPTI